MYIYEQSRTVPEEALKPIKGGRLNGFTDINPMWRIKKLTELYGPCGEGWYIDLRDRWLDSAGDEIVATVIIELYTKNGDEWSRPILGIGGSKFATKERSGLYVSDEMYKMALTDAISVACKHLGFAADIYYAKDRTKYDIPNDIEKGADNARRMGEPKNESKSDIKASMKEVSERAKALGLNANDIALKAGYTKDEGMSEDVIAKMHVLMDDIEKGA